MPGVTLVRVSRYRDTRPIGGPTGQGLFLNGACLLETELSPHDVLDMLAAVENTLDRERGERWGPRTVDLDLLLYDDVILDTNTLTVPHPRMVTRRFVLEPCVEIAPEFVHPLAGCSLECLLDSISMPHPYVAVIGVPGTGAAEVAAAIADATLARLVAAPPEYAVVDSLAAHPETRAGVAPWQRAVESCAKPLLANRWRPDPHGTVSDYWLHTVRLAAADSLSAEPSEAFESAFTRLAAETVSPQVAILLVASPESLEERITVGGRPGGRKDAVFSLRSQRSAAANAAGAAGPQSGTAACVAADGSVARLLRLQDQLIASLRGRDLGLSAQGPKEVLLVPPRPRAVVTIAADDLGQAVQEAVAAVEALA